MTATGNLATRFTPEQWQAFGAAGGTIGSDYKITGGSGTVIGDGFGGRGGISNGEFTLGADNGLGSLGGLNTAINAGKLGVGLGQLYLGYKQYGLAKDQFAYNKMSKDREYAANAAEYNNALARTAAVDKFYGTQSAGKPIKA